MAVLNMSPWEWFCDFYDRIKPQDDELWVTNGRINEVWQSAFDDIRKPYIAQLHVFLLNTAGLG